MKECNNCLLTDDILGVIIDDTCNFCKLHDELNNLYPISRKLEKELINRIKKRAKGKYDCLIGISGGMDSSYLLYWAFIHKLKTLAFHFDNGFNTDEAEHNIKVMLNYTGYSCIRISINQNELNELNKAFLIANVSDVDIPNDIAMSKLMIDIAIKYKIKTILNGHSFREEGSVPIGWTYMDGAYIKDVYKQIMNKSLTDFPILTIWDQIRASLLRIKQERPFYYMNHDKEKTIQFLSENFNWKRYEGRHCENKYTQFAGWSIYSRFGIDKRIIQLSANIRTGKYTKDQAKQILKEDITIPFIILNEIQEKLNIDISIFKKSKRNMFYNYKTYHKKFIRLKWLIWIGVKLKVLPVTFYKKYTQKF